MEGIEKSESEQKLEKYKRILQKQRENIPSKFIVYVSSEFNSDGQNAGSNITAWVDRKFHTLEEKRTEFIYKNNTNMEKQTLYYGLQENKYHVYHNDNNNETRIYYGLNLMKNLVGEGANFLLIRYLAITRYMGKFELSTIQINGEICRNIYECKGPKPAIVNNYPIEVCKIHRIIISKCGQIETSTTELTVHGLIIKQERNDCPYILQINPLLITKGKPMRYEYLRCDEDEWKKNFELMSMYLNYKDEIKLKMETYIHDHPEVIKILSDYLQNMLLLRPENVMQVTFDYFSKFYPYKFSLSSDDSDDDENQDP